MNSKDPKHLHIWTEKYLISSFLVNLRGRAGLYAMLNLLQDAGWMHAHQMNLKMDPNHSFVFTRQKLLMQEWPAWHQSVTIKTWLRPPDGTFIFRDYEVFLNDKKIGEATASFVVIDRNLRKPVRVDWSHVEAYWRKDHRLNCDPEKIQVEASGEVLARYHVRNSDLDTNNHVNNTNYSKWVLDSLPLDILKSGVHLHGYEVNFIAEAKLGDEVIVRRSESKTDESSIDTTIFQGLRAADEKTIFTARLISSAQGS